MSARTELNKQLCGVLGIEPHNVTRVVLVLDRYALPMVRVTRNVRTVDGVQQVTQRFDLVPHDRK